MAAVLNTEDDKNIVENSVISPTTGVQGERLHASQKPPRYQEQSKEKYLASYGRELVIPLLITV